MSTKRYLLESLERQGGMALQGRGAAVRERCRRWPFHTWRIRYEGTLERIRALGEGRYEVQVRDWGSDRVHTVEVEGYWHRRMRNGGWAKD